MRGKGGWKLSASSWPVGPFLLTGEFPRLQFFKGLRHTLPL